MARWMNKGYVSDSDDDCATQSSDHEDQNLQHAQSDVCFNAGNTLTPALPATVQEAHGECKSVERGPALLEKGVLSRIEEPENSQNLTTLSSSQDAHGEKNPVLLIEDDLENVQPPSYVGIQGLQDSQPGESRASTPLSDAPSSPPDLPTLLGGTTNRSEKEDSHQAKQTYHTQFLTSSPLQEPAQSDQNPIPALTNRNSSRNFRQRQPIQLQPYMLEYAKYSKAQRDHGLKPILLPLENARTAADESQNTDTSLVGNDPPSSSPADVDEFPSAESQSLEASGSDGDELPDINALFRMSSSKYSSNGVKRRKIFRNSSPSGKSPHGSKISKDGRLQNSPASDDDFIFNVPPSPPRSGGPSPPQPTYQSTPRFRMPTYRTSTTIPTPITSSEPRNQARRQASPIEVSSTDASSGPEDEHESKNHVHPRVAVDEEIQQAQRRIRGVLPASWLKLDLKAQSTKTKQVQRRLSSASPRQPSPQRGVARRLHKDSIKSSIINENARDVFILTDEESTEALSPSRHGLLQSFEDSEHAHFGRAEEDMSTFRYGEATEDDTVDAMLPSAKRSRPYSKTSAHHKKVRRASKVASKQTYIRSDQQAPKEHSRQPKITIKFNKPKKKTQSRLPKVGILDIATHDGSSKTVPDFVRIASRTARSHPKKGRSSLSSKYLRLSNKQDNEDMHETVSAWREGTIALRPHENRSPNCKILRHPLKPRPINSPVASSLQNPLDERKNSTPGIQIVSEQNDRIRGLKSNEASSTIDNGLSARNITIPNRQKFSFRSTKVKPKRTISTQRGSVADLRRAQNARPAMLEESLDNTRQHQSHTLRDRLRVFNAQTSLSRIHGGPDDYLDTGLEEQPTVHNAPSFLVSKDAHISRSNGDIKRSPKQQHPKIKRPRKRTPRQLLFQNSSIEENVALFAVDHSDCDSLQEAPSVTDLPYLVGLGPFGTQYTDSFGINPLAAGTCFHHSTFLGSGEFRKSLQADKSALAKTPIGSFSFEWEGRNFEWGYWNETVSSDLGYCFDNVASILRDATRPDFSQIFRTGQPSLSLLKMVLSYLNENLRFSDPIDRVSFLQRSHTLSSDLLTVTTANSLEANTSTCRPLYLQILITNLVIVNKIRQLSEHKIVSSQTRIEIQSLLKTWIREAWAEIKKDIASFNRCLSKIGHSVNSQLVLSGDEPIVEAFVIIQHVMIAADFSAQTRWEILCLDGVQWEGTKALDVKATEHSWQQLFCLLPFLEFDDQGILEVGRRFEVRASNWDLVKQLVCPVLDIYCRNARGQAPSFNTYCRALFSRCLRLINGWGWYQCETMIGTLFDFFAKINLGHLRNEESHGSPAFLEQLDSSPILKANPEDRCFHLLLKIVASGLRSMRKVYSDKKIRDIAWRLMPNHGRSHPKEQSIRQEDLDALRNHHDLLCTLYWASPPGFRPALSAIRNLVDLGDSHREACRIAICSWKYLAKFQVTSSEPLEKVHDFQLWHNEFLNHMTKQHSLARVEAEDHFKRSSNSGVEAYSRKVLESTIASNQRHVEEVLGDSLASLDIVINLCPNKYAAAALISPSLGGVFDLFSSSGPQTHKTIMACLDIILSYQKKCTSDRNVVSVAVDDDSQEYGDWSAFEASDPAHDITQASDGKSFACLNSLQGSLRNLLSNCFGADNAPNDDLLGKLITVWVAIASLFVQDGLRSWSDYLDPYGQETWTSLRKTRQTRVYTPYFIASLITIDRQVYQSNRQSILVSWMDSLVERESLLKHQHSLTNALLNMNTDDALLVNLPFSQNTPSGSYNVTPIELSERRHSLISSLLSNMRVSLHTRPPGEVAGLRQDYNKILKSLMLAMRRNYEELDQGSNGTSAYVDFIHQTVSILQEQSSAICPVDRFFTDNALFPLPSADPTYVVGQLKNYGLHLHEQRTPKQLAVFLLSISERAAVDGQQAQLSEQLYSAAADVHLQYQSGLTLRRFLVRHTLPAYIQAAFQLSCGWIFILPLMETLHKVFGEIFLHLDGYDKTSVEAAQIDIEALRNCMQCILMAFLEKGKIQHDAWLIYILAACFEILKCLIPTLSYMTRLGGDESFLTSCRSFLDDFCSFACLLHLDSDDSSVASNYSSWKKDDSQRTRDEIQTYSCIQLQDTIKKNWSRTGDEYFFTKGPTRRQVVVDMGLYEEEYAKLIAAINLFQRELTLFAPFKDLVEEVQTSGNKSIVVPNDILF